MTVPFGTVMYVIKITSFTHEIHTGIEIIRYYENIYCNILLLGNDYAAFAAYMNCWKCHILIYI